MKLTRLTLALLVSAPLTAAAYGFGPSRDVLFKIKQNSLTGSYYGRKNPVTGLVQATSHLVFPS